MLNLGSTISALRRQRNRFGDYTVAALSAHTPKDASHLTELVDFGANPGNLRAWRFIPDRLPAKAPLIVILHGCGQSAAEYDQGAGWSALAEEVGAAALFPEQKPSNNSLMCFNWFSPRDARRESGEVSSIRQMINQMVEDHGLDRKRIFITGLSAGGAMAGAMLALYPEVFSAGAIIAGLPFGAATNALEAIAIMSHGAERSPELTAMARAAASYRGRWPRVAVWQGSADEVVHPSNGDRLVEQWLYVHGLKNEGALKANAGYWRRIWRDYRGRALVEHVVIDEMGHGTPVKSSAMRADSGRYILDIGLSSTRCIARFWELLPEETRSTRAATQALASSLTPALRYAAHRLVQRLQRLFPSFRQVSSFRRPQDIRRPDAQPSRSGFRF